jgi:uncharacterized protein YjbI with pentapeptide repeats
MRDENEATEQPASKLKPANENPWYVLMTLAGEQKGLEVNVELNKRNAKLWNEYIGVQSRKTDLERIKDHGLVFETDGQRGVTSRRILDGFPREWRIRHGPSVPVPEIPSPNDPVDLGGVYFEHFLLAKNMFFPSKVNLKGACFQKDALFIECGFAKRVCLSDAEILGSAEFTGSRFVSDFHADALKIGDRLYVNSVTVDGDLELKRLSVGGLACLENLMVKGDAIFDDGHFDQSSGFHRSEFSGNTSFDATIFKGSVNFISSAFSARTSFSKAKFFGSANFSGSEFLGVAVFRATYFSFEASFPTATFHDRVDFGEAVFRGRSTRETEENVSPTRFAATDFKGPVDFSYAKFVASYPDFSGAVIPEKTSFSAKSKHWPATTKQSTELAKECCATVRHIHAKQGLPEDEHFFFRKEMHFAGKIGSFWQRLPYLLFGLFSDYGHSIARPTLWLLGLWGFGFVAFWGYLAGCCVPAPLEVAERPMGTAMGLSFSNLFPLFGFGRVFFGEEFMEPFPAVLKLLSGFQTVASLPLLFFLGLGLRQRFRLR